MLLSIKASIGAHALIQGLQISKQSIELNAISKPTGALTLVWQRKLITTYLETTLQMQCNITYGRCPNNTLKRNLLTQNGHARWGASNYLTLPIPNVYIYKNNIYIYIAPCFYFDTLGPKVDLQDFLIQKSKHSTWWVKSVNMPNTSRYSLHIKLYDLK